MPRRYLPWAVALGLVWSVGGLHVDGWAHSHGRVSSGTPFTPWHAIEYTGMLATTCALASCWLAGRRAGESWRTALPAGYGLSLVGALVFGLGGALDLLWHVIFGVERTFSALMSPTHFLLNVGIVMIGLGALGASWRSTKRRADWSDIVIATMVLSMLTFWSLFDDIFTTRYATGSFDSNITPNGELLMELSVFSVLYRSAALVGVILTLMRRYELPRGALTLLIGLNGAFLLYMLTPGSSYIVVPVATGVVADVLYATLRPSLTREPQLRIFCFAVPSFLFASFFALAGVRVGIWWPIHVWAGTILGAGGAGVAVSYLVLPTIALPGASVVGTSYTSGT